MLTAECCCGQTTADTRRRSFEGDAATEKTRGDFLCRHATMKACDGCERPGERSGCRLPRSVRRNCVVQQEIEPTPRRRLDGKFAPSPASILHHRAIPGR